MKRISVYCISGVMVLLSFALYVQRPVPDKVPPIQSGKEEGNLVDPENSEASSTPFTKMVQTGIEQNRIAQEQLDKQQADHYKELLDRKQEADRKKAEEAAYWESRQEWIEQFPFEPTYHESITFDPEIYDPNGPGPSVLDEVPKEYDQMARLVKNHGFLKAFYENPNRYSPEFELICQILVEEGISPDPLLSGWLYTNIADYHKAASHALKKAWPMNSSETWGDKLESNWESILGTIKTERSDGSPAEGQPSHEQALKIRERLINEIPVEGFLKIGWLEDFAYNGNHTRQLKPGDPILIR